MLEVSQHCSDLVASVFSVLFCALFPHEEKNNKDAAITTTMVNFFILRLLKINSYFTAQRYIFFKIFLLLYENFSAILYVFSYRLILKALGGMSVFEVTIWQPCLLLRSALNCIQVTHFNYKGNRII